MRGSTLKILNFLLGADHREVDSGAFEGLLEIIMKMDIASIYFCLFRFLYLKSRLLCVPKKGKKSRLKGSV